MRSPNSQKKRRNPLSSNFLFSIILMNLVITVLLNSISFFLFSQVVISANRKHFVRHNQRNIELSLENIDHYLFQSAQHISAQYFSQISNNKPMLLPNTKDISSAPQDIRALSDRLDDILLQYPSLSGIDIYYPKTKTAVTSGRSTAIHFDVDATRLPSYLPWYGDFSTSGRNWAFSPLAKQQYTAGEPTIVYTTKIPPLSQEPNRTVLALHISAREFNQYLDESVGHLMIYSPDKTLLYETADGTSYRDELRQLSAAGSLPDTAGTQSLVLDKEKMVLVQSRSATSGLTYLFLVPNQVFFEEYTPLLKLFVGSIVAGILVNAAGIVFLAYRNNRRYYQQVKHVATGSGLLLENPAKSFDQSLAALSHHIHTLQTSLNESQPLQVQNNIRALLFRQEEDAHLSLVEQMPYSALTAVIIHYPEEHTSRQALALLRPPEPTEGAPYSLIITPLQPGEQLAMLSHGPEDFPLVFEQFITLLQEKVPNHQAYAGQVLSNTAVNFPKALASAKETYRYHYIYPKAKWLTFQQIFLEEKRQTGSHLRIFSKIEEAIMLEDTDLCQKEFLMLVEAFRHGNYEVDYCISTLRDLVSRIFSVMEAENLDTWVLFGYDIRSYFNEIPHIEEYYNWMLHVTTLLIQTRLARKEQVDTNLQQAILAYIQDNLENDISLDLLSDAMGMRADVLSREFRPLMGKSYSAYIREEKMKRAIELLRADLPVSEVAGQLGYSSTQYFIRIFKSTYGETPYQYYKQHLQE